MISGAQELVGRAMAGMREWGWWVEDLAVRAKIAILGTVACNQDLIKCSVHRRFVTAAAAVLHGASLVIGPMIANGMTTTFAHDRKPNTRL
jgi:hypothetical protein